MGSTVGWLTGATFAALALVGPDVVRLFLGRTSGTGDAVLWICSGALCLDAAYHGVVQILAARGEQRVIARYFWLELIINLLATFVGVDLFGPVGSALALALTTAVMDLVVFPVVMRGRWGSPAGRFVLRRGVLHSAVGAGLVLVIGTLPVVETNGLLAHLIIAVSAFALAGAGGMALMGRGGRTRLAGLITRPGTLPA
jgi:O-antigen/teichoic acid export membrane protein